MNGFDDMLKQGRLGPKQASGMPSPNMQKAGQMPQAQPAPMQPPGFGGMKPGMKPGMPKMMDEQ